MAKTPFVVEGFKGLRLDISSEALGLNGAVDLLNVDFDRSPAVRARGSSLKWNANTLSSTGYQAIFRSPTNGGEFILIRGATAAPAVSIDRMPDGGTISNVGSVAFNAIPISAASLGTLTTSTIYFTLYTSPSTGQTIRKYDGAALGTGTGKPLHVATWPVSNRLVQGGYFAAADAPGGANGSRSTVFFSDPGAPDTYGANNFVTLRPGDGESITAIVSWRDLLFVFKESSVFIFYGESTDSGGNPVFSYRRVDLPDPILDPLRSSVPGPAATAGPDAVYYATPRGIYRTAGNSPDYFSTPVARMFTTDSSLSSSLQTNGAAPSLAWTNKRLIATYLTGLSAVLQLVYHAPSGQWTVWNLPGSLFSTAPQHLGADALAVGEGFWFINGNDVWAWTNSYPGGSDGGSNITWSYKTGRYAVSDPGRAAVTPDHSLVGTGTVTVRLDSDLYSNQSASVTLGTAPTAAEGWPTPLDQEGRWLQMTLSGTGGATVNEVKHYVSNVLGAGVG